ncbi:MAG: helix-turn-helix domain-containing protein [Candidatus Omnitrophica bacterium]|nr:helix-turn-helix domain-containing protein [Candidatus Omnitrophota bacterium]
MNIKTPLLLSIKDVKKILGVNSDATIYNYIKAGILPYRQIGKFRRFTLDDINTFLENCKSATNLPKATPSKALQFTGEISNSL